MGCGAWGMSQEFMARAAFCQLGSRRVDVRRSSSGGVISVLGTPSMAARRQPQAHSACPTGGERAGAASTSLRLRWRCADRRSAPPIASSAGGRTGIIPPLVAGGGEAKGGSRVRAAVCVTIAATRGSARFRAPAGYTLSSIGPGSESPPGWRQHTPGQVMRWGGVLIKP